MRDALLIALVRSDEIEAIEDRIDEFLRILHEHDFDVIEGSRARAANCKCRIADDEGRVLPNLHRRDCWAAA